MAKPPLDITSTDIHALFELIYRMRDTPVLSSKLSEEKRQAHMDRSWELMVAGKTWGEASGGLALLNQPEQSFRQELKNTNDDLGVQVSRVQSGLTQWFENGEPPAPYYPNRIAIILRKAKKLDLEKAFLAVWCLHFGTRFVGATDHAIQARAKKIGVLGLKKSRK